MPGLPGDLRGRRRRGDMYAPAGRATFDRILAHPPYVPSLRTGQLFRDGGEDGERLTRRVVEGLPNYLHPGGRLYLLAMLAEYPDDPIDGRMRRWLRDAEGEFDMVVVMRRSIDARAFLFDNCAPDDLVDWRQFVEQRDIRQFRYVNAIVERHREPAMKPLTVVRESGEGYTIGDAERLLPMVRRLEDDTWLASARPRTVAGLQCETRSHWHEGGWHEQRRIVSHRAPFRVQEELPEWAPEFLARCDGTRTLAELGQADFVRRLLAHGILEAE